MSDKDYRLGYDAGLLDAVIENAVAIGELRDLRADLERVTAERDAARRAARAWKLRGNRWRLLAWNFEYAEEVELHDNIRQLWGTMRTWPHPWEKCND